MSPRVVVVVPVWNNRILTRECLASLRALPSRAPFEIVVVDNGSTDGIERELVEMADRGEISLVRNAENRGYARATNQGIDALPDSEFVLLLNNDTIALPGWLDGLVDELDAHPEADVAGSLLLYPDRRTIQHAGMTAGRIAGRIAVIHRWQFRLLERTPQALVAGEIDAVTGASMLARRSAVQRVGGLSERYVNGFEDLDFCWRIRAGDRRVRYSPASRLVHLESRTPGRRAREEANFRLFQKTWGSRKVDTSADFLENIRELRLRKRLEVDPENPGLLVALRRLLGERSDGEPEELEARLRNSSAPNWRKWIAFRFGR